MATRKRRERGPNEIRIARFLTDDRLMELLRKHPRLRVDLADLATAPNPASTKHRIIGPAVVEYVLHPDGGIDATVARS